MTDADNPATLTAAERRLSLAAAIASITVVGIGLGASIPLLALALERQALPGALIGFNTAMPAIAGLIITPFVPALMRWMSTIPLLIGSILLAAGGILVLYAFPQIWLWFVIRFGLGLTLTIVFVVSETWINQLATEASRGRLMGLYATILSAGFATGPVILYTAGVSGIAPYAAIAGLISLAIIPLILARRLAPQVTEKPSRSFALFLVAAPAATFAALVFGAVETDVFNMLPIYAVRIGMGEQGAAFVLSLFAAGNIFCQIPLGYLADKMDRRLVLVLCSLTALLGAACLPLAAQNIFLFVPLLFLFGGAAVGLYTVGLTLLGQKFRGADLAAANAAFIMMYNLGAVIGPPSAGVAMDIWNPHGLAVALAVLCGSYTLIAGWRYLSQPPATAQPSDS